MKKLLKIMLISLLAFVCADAEAQKQGQFFLKGQDTLIKSDTLFCTFQLPANKLQSVSVQTFYDRISGTTKNTTFLQRSLDGINYSTVKQVSINTTADTSVYLDTSAFYGNYLRLYMVTDTTTQRVVPKVYIVSW